MNDSAQAGTARDVVVIGASAGGVGVLPHDRQRAGGRPAGRRARGAAHGRIPLPPSPNILGRAGRNTASIAEHMEPLRRGHITVARPDHHLLIDNGMVVLTRGPKEHHTRPATRPAVPLGRAVGRAARDRRGVERLQRRRHGWPAGHQAVRRAGGVQDPKDAEEPVMPASALTHVAVDRCLAARQLAGATPNWFVNRFRLWPRPRRRS
jgi:two-component system chemotaxis response regulator CheB